MDGDQISCSRQIQIHLNFIFAVSYFTIIHSRNAATVRRNSKNNNLITYLFIIISVAKERDGQIRQK